MQSIEEFFRLKSYFHHLKAKDLKEIILRSVYVPNTEQVLIPGQQSDEMEEIKNLSVSGGIVNLYNAIILIEKEYLRH